MGIYADITDELAGAGSITGTCEVVVGRSFASVRLDSGEIGSAMDYSRYGAPDGRSVEVATHRTAVGELLDGFPDCADIARLATQVAAVIALSRHAYLPDRLAAARIRTASLPYASERRLPLTDSTRRRLLAALGGATCVGIVGFGGLMEMVASLSQIERVYVFDRDISWRQERMHATLFRLNSELGREVITLHAPEELLGLASAELQAVQVTGSMLSNGSADELLATVSHLPLVVAGPTAAINPEHWFARGARLICTELRQPSFWRTYLYDDHLYEFETEYAERTYVWRDEDAPS